MAKFKRLMYLSRNLSSFLSLFVNQTFKIAFIRLLKLLRKVHISKTLTHASHYTLPLQILFEPIRRLSRAVLTALQIRPSLPKAISQWLG